MPEQGQDTNWFAPVACARMTTNPPMGALDAPTQPLPQRIPGATLNPTPDVLLPVPADQLLNEVEAIMFADIVARFGGDPTTGPIGAAPTECRCGQPQPGVRVVGRARVRQSKKKVRGGRRRTRRLLHDG